MNGLCLCLRIVAISVGFLPQGSDGNRPRSSQSPPLASPASRALQSEPYPWYDAHRDQVRPLLPDPTSWSAWLSRQGQALADWLERWIKRSPEPTGANGPRSGARLPTLLMLAGGGILMALLWRLWRWHKPGPASIRNRATIGEAARIAGLAPGDAREGLDPMAEARRKQAAGDARGAVVWLFLDQLLALDHAGLIRIVPGRTGRQYVAMLADPSLRDGLNATLRVFEQACYGHQTPGPESVALAWRQAETLRRRVATLAPGAGA